jgi:hypothetical protein
MATRSSIAMKTENGIRGIYCHWDGYPEHNGKILSESYTDADKVKSLIDLGDLSSLRKDIGQKHSFDAKYSDQPELSEMFDDWTTAYHRDRGEAWANTAPQTYATVKEWQEAFDGSGCEYFYLFDNNTWEVSNA